MTEVIRRAGPRHAVQMVRQRIWHDQTHLVLRCDLGGIPPVPPAQIPVEMRQADEATFKGFEAELPEPRAPTRTTRARG